MLENLAGILGPQKDEEINTNIVEIDKKKYPKFAQIEKLSTEETIRQLAIQQANEVSGSKDCNIFLFHVLSFIFT